MIQFILGKKSHFQEDGTQNYLVFQPIKRFFKVVVVLVMVVTFITGNLKGCLLKEFILFKTSDYKITPYLSYYDITKIRVIWMLFKAS